MPPNGVRRPNGPVAPGRACPEVLPKARGVLVLGCRGMLGSACMRAFGPNAAGCDLAEFDIADGRRTLAEIERLAPQLIVNCAAATDVDRCELDHDYADAANAGGPAHVAAAAAAVGARLIHLSTDFVFDGAKNGPYVETDKPRPLSHYGLSKLRGEEAVLETLPEAVVVRTSWLYGKGDAHFVAKVLHWASSLAVMRVVDDQRGSPTYAEDLADALRALAAAGGLLTLAPEPPAGPVGPAGPAAPPAPAEDAAPAEAVVGAAPSRTDAPVRGVYHLGGAGCVTRYDWAREILALTGSDATLLPAKTTEFPLPAVRPAQSCLDCSKAAALGVRLPPWPDGLGQYLRSLEVTC